MIDMNDLSRIPRDLETREAELRDMDWSPAEMIPTVLPRDGFSFRWIRVATRGETDAVNVDRAYRNGWVPATGSDVPELAHLGTKDGRGQDMLIYGGLVLCKTADEKVEQYKNYVQRRTQAQTQSVDSQLRNSAAEDRRMPLFSEVSRQVRTVG